MESQLDTTTKHKWSLNQKWAMASNAIGDALENMDSMFVSFAMTPIIMELHLSGAEGGMMVTANDIGMLVGSFIFGMIADAFGRVRTLTYSIFLAAIATGGMYFAHGAMFIYAMRFIEGLGNGGEYGAGVTLIAENFKGHKIGALESYANSVGETGAIVAAVLSAIILPMFGWHTLFLFGLIPVILAYFVRRNLKESPDFEKNIKRRVKHHKRFPNLKQLFITPRIAWQTIGIMLMAMVEEAGYDGIISWMPSMMQKKLHTNVTNSSLWMISTIIGFTLGAIVFGKLLDKKGPRIAFSTFFIISAISVFAIPLSFNAITLVIAATVVGFFVAATYSGYGVLVSRLYPMNIRVTANNLIENVGVAFGGLAPIIIGFLMQKYSLTAVMIFLSGLYVLSLIVLFSIPSLKNFNEKESNNL